MSNTTTFEKSISYDRNTHDFCATLDGSYIGHYNSYHEAECALDQVAYDLLMDGQCTTATELDAGSDVDAIAADTLVIRADAPAQLAAVVQADALLSEADAVLGTCESAGCGSVATHHLRILDTPRVERVCCEHYPDITGESCACNAEECVEYGPCDYPGDSASSDDGPYASYVDIADVKALLTPAPTCAGFEPGRCATPPATVFCEMEGCTADATYTEPFPLCSQHYAEHVAPTCAGFIPGICANPADPATAPYCRQCAVGIDKTLVAAYVQKLMEDAGLACQFCGEPHTADACPLRKPLVAPAPTTCQNCGGQHSIQRCPAIWTLLRRFA